jgi:site-specific DNA-methyltransferase (adenine-specific)
MFEYKIINGKSEEVIPTLEDNSIDLVVTSPPYNVDLGNNKYNETPYNLYNDNKEHKDYILWLEDIFRKIYPKLKSSGRISINIGDGKNGQVCSHSDIIYFMTKNLNYIPITTIIWEKHQVANRCSWGSYLSPSCPSFPCPFEYILIFAKDSKKLLTQGETDLTKDEFIKGAYGIWNIAPETKMKKIGHPAIFPVQLPLRLIKMLSWKETTVLDPFSGSGTTGIACKLSGRKYIGIELSEDYCKLSKERIDNSETDIFG